MYRGYEWTSMSANKKTIRVSMIDCFSTFISLLNSPQCQLTTVLKYLLPVPMSCAASSLHCNTLPCTTQDLQDRGPTHGNTVTLLSNSLLRELPLVELVDMVSLLTTCDSNLEIRSSCLHTPDTISHKLRGFVGFFVWEKSVPSSSSETSVVWMYLGGIW